MSVSNTHQPLPGDVVSDVRYEIKIPFPSEKNHEIMVWIHCHPELWRKAFPPRQVNNIYFDTFSMTNLDTNLSGISERQKLRIRWYGKAIERVENAQFEIKHKQGSIGWKSIHAIPGMLNLSQCSWHEIMAFLKSRMQIAHLLLQRHPVPTIVSSYYRAYYTSPDGILRLTVDTQLTAYDQKRSLSPNIRYRSLPQPYTIVEIKTHPDHAARLTRAVSHSSTRVSRFSKYVHAVMASP